MDSAHHDQSGLETPTTESPAVIAVDPASPGEIEDLAAERLVFFSDAVVAIAITLLAIDLPIPVGHDHNAFLASLRMNASEYWAFLLSFAVIAFHWTHHHRVFKYLARATGQLVTLNFAWLLLVVVTPFMTKLLGSEDLTLIKFGMYAGTQGAQTAVFAAIIWTMTKQGLFQPRTRPPATARDAVAPAAAFLVSIPVFALVGQWAFLCWLLIPFLASRIPRARRRAKPSATSG